MYTCIENVYIQIFIKENVHIHILIYIYIYLYDAGDAFLWKDGVDAVRGAAHHAQQFSAFLGLLSKRSLSLATIEANHSNRCA